MMTPRIGSVLTKSTCRCGRCSIDSSMALLVVIYMGFALVLGLGHGSSSFLPSWEQTVFPDTNHVLLLKSWSLSSLDQKYVNISTTVPGDLLSDLMEAQIVDDPYIDRNFLSQRRIWMGDGDVDDDERKEDADEVGGRPDTTGPTIPRLLVTETKTRSRTWVYSTTFDIPSDFDRHRNSKSITWMIILEGIKMGAEVRINGVSLGIIQDQFLRYELVLPDDVLSRGVLLTNGYRSHEVTISFPPSIHVDGRFTASSGGWDWAPYVRVRDDQDTQMYTLGIVKPIYVVGIEHFAIIHVVPKINYLGPYPRTPLSQAEGDFKLDVDVHLKFANSSYFSVAKPTEESLTLTLTTDFGTQVVRQNIPQVSTANLTVVTLSLLVRKGDVQLWWPNGMGAQCLYNISVGVTNSDVIIQKRIGFRTSALVTVNDTNEEVLSETIQGNQEGSGQHGMYFRINGAVLMARGANFVPMDQLEGRLSEQGHKVAVQSAARANMNMIRVWGGGMVPLSSFYEACDEEGILLYHDMMFLDEEGHRPVKTETIEKEIRHLVRSLSSHPSIVVWNGCNECDVVMGRPSEIYATFVMKTVSEEDDTRSIWPSSPSRHGWKSGVRQLDSRPLHGGEQLSTFDPNAFPTQIESHGPYMRSFSYSFPGVNGLDVHFPYTNTPPRLKETVDIGPSYPNEFGSEFGSSVMSSFESMTGTLSPKFWSLHGGTAPDDCEHVGGNDNTCNGTNVMAERNYPCDSHIRAYFGVEEVDLNGVGSAVFQKQLYMCLVSQALWMKGEIETRRSRNMFGLLIWQLNENWPTGGWGVIEYGLKSDDGSQILGGRWKPLMHLLESSLYRDQIVACGENDLCYLRNDGMVAIDIVVTLEAWLLTEGVLSPTETMVYTFFLASGQIQWFTLPSAFTANKYVFLIQTKVSPCRTSWKTPETISNSVYLKAMPKDIPGLCNPVLVNVLSVKATSEGDAVIILTSDGLALFVVLTTRAAGRFSENCFTVVPGEKKEVRFQSFDGSNVNTSTLRRTLRVEHLGLYMVETVANAGASLSEEQW